MKKCAKCLKNNPLAARYCMHCGESLNNERVTTKEKNDEKQNWKILRGLEKYTEIANLLNSANLSKDIKFRRLFTGFYKVRRNQGWLDMYYNFFEECKTKQNLNFKETIEYIFEKTGRIEASFSSKLLATINVNMPIWDQYVLANLCIKPVPAYWNKEKRIQASIEAYDQICSWYRKFCSSPEGIELISKSDAIYPQYKSTISNVKKVDFVLWQTRE